MSASRCVNNGRKFQTSLGEKKKKLVSKNLSNIQSCMNWMAFPHIIVMLSKNLQNKELIIIDK